jgi:DNA polymerase
MTRAEAAAAEQLSVLQEGLRGCRECGLCAERTQVVFGVGDPCAQLMFVGEGPGFHEDRQGEPFVGQAGKLLNELLADIGLTRADVYIANVVKCRPPNNRDPLPDEIAVCSPKLMEQIRIIRPHVLCTLGRFASHLIGSTQAPMGAIRGKAKDMEVAGVPVIVFPVYHPAAALYTPANKEILREDFRRLRVLLDRGHSALRTSQTAEGPPCSGEEDSLGQEAITPVAAGGPFSSHVSSADAPSSSAAPPYADAPTAATTDGEEPLPAGASAGEDTEQLKLW